ncbi:dihydrolipoyl dehydrogenase [Nakamurella flavida]|uniref:Dihydrolipoyl dehydrogenase n=1 Tax=Nakamurella flavida TaxID=363630 RepID=A0A938YK86_9ACTN|nr:dihydrolipoyl dehydrogenase [Nakamurella flavida]MBM9474844.1 dihydrolipoyl dehydrogenase [Nakamurella flavida]MDP9776414.1 dihydrolipoamide dehydrogenase [Nakamurella flavida]
MSDTNVDLVVLGGGSGGYAAALRAAELGSSVVLIEKEKVGGTCLHWGCVPAKTLLHAAEVADEAREGLTLGVRTSFDGVDVPALLKYKDGVINRLYKGLQGLIKSRKITTVEGVGRYEGGTTVSVGEDRYIGKDVVLATGSYSRSLPGLEIEGRVITSTQALSLEWIPQKAIVLGGGVIGVEFASTWASFGAEVTIVEALPSLVPAEDPWAVKQLERAFRKRKIAFKTGVRFSGVTQDESGVTVTLEDGTTLQADLLLVAVGRGPATAGCGFEEAGVTMDRGFVITDERLHTNLPHVYAVGDIVPGLQLAHRGFQQGIFVAEEIAGLDPVVVPDVNIPKITYCDPNIASVGLTEAKAVEQHGKDAIETYAYDLGGNGKSQILKTAGGVKVVRVKDGPIVGVHMVGARVGELIGEAQLIVNWEAYPEDVAPLVHGHPSQYEAVGEAMLAMAGKPLHVHD